MENFIAAVIVMMSLSLATFQIVRNYKYKELTERRHKLLVIILYMEAVLVLCDLLSGNSGLGVRLVIDEMLALIPLQLLSSSTWPKSGGVKVARIFIALMALLSMYYSLCALGLARHVSSDAYIYVVATSAFCACILFISGIWFRLREVKAVLQAGTVWACLALAIDVIYMVFVMMEVMGLIMFYDRIPISTSFFCILLCATVASYGIRIITDSLFIFYRRHERRIVESMKISPVEVAGMSPRENDIFKDIYDRVLEYFETEKPFLNGDLTINDIVAVVYTNKLYISRAISQSTGRNFCQFVNYHRVMYSVECFRKNPELKIAELWPMCGFNTIVSFNMAFRLFMGENPSDWCRKEKIKLFRKGK